MYSYELSSYQSNHRIEGGCQLLILRLAPVCPVDDAFMTSEFGMRNHPILRRRKMHKGIDFAAVKGTPVRSIWNGVVVKSRSTLAGYGRIVVVETEGTRVLYAHLSERKVARGDRVSAGDVVGLVGSSGASTGPHLHLGMYRGRRAVNPSLLLAGCR